MNTCIRHVTLHFRFRHGAKLRSVTEIAPKSPFLCAKRSPFRYWFRAGTNRLRPGSDAELFMSRTEFELRPADLKLKESTEAREWHWYPSCLVHLELSRWMLRPSMGHWVCQIFLEAHSCQPFLVLPISCGKCDVSKLRDFCWDMAENSQ